MNFDLDENKWRLALLAPFFNFRFENVCSRKGSIDRSSTTKNGGLKLTIFLTHLSSNQFSIVIVKLIDKSVVS